jgi:hypothetical protein
MGTKRIQNTDAFGADVKVSGDLTRILLACGAVAGPLYLAVALAQGLTREGFDFSRHAVSLLSNGELGWIQITNFLVAGLLVIAGAAGMRRALGGSQGGTWGPYLLGLYGLGLIGAGIFPADPASGFPPGTPARASELSVHGLLHFTSGGIGFLGLVAACFVSARRFAALRQGGWAVYSATTGVVFLAAFFGIASGSGQSGIILAFWIATVLAWIWITLLAIRVMGELGDAKR